MISAKLIKDLEKQGFELEFPSYTSNEEEIIDILKEKNERLYLAIPLLLKQNFDYKKIAGKLNKAETLDFNKIILIADRIFNSEKINTNIKQIIIKNHIKGAINKNEFQYYYDAFKQFAKKEEKIIEESQQEQLNIRSSLTTNEALSKIFSPAKIRIMAKILAHEKLTNTELKYYYKAIKPLIHSILNENLQKYLNIIEETKKYR